MIAADDGRYETQGRRRARASSVEAGAVRQVDTAVRLAKRGRQSQFLDEIDPIGI